MVRGGRSFKHRLISAFLSTALFATAVLAGVTLNDKTVYADDPFVKTAENTGLGTGAIGNPVHPANTDSAWSGSYVYYGKYDGTNPTKYRVLNNAETKYGGNTLFLDCDSVLYKTEFDKDGVANTGANRANEWAYSDVKAGLIGDQFLEKEGVFSQAEKDAMVLSTVEGHDLVQADNDAVEEAGRVSSRTQSEYVKYIALNNERVFLLDSEDASNNKYGYSMAKNEVINREKNYSGSVSGWWLRSASPNPDAVLAGCVSGGSSLNVQSVNYSFGVSPAFNVNLESVIFTSLTSGTSGQPGAEYKLTLSDNNMHIALTDGKDVTRNGSTVTVPYAITGTDAGNATRVSVLITDEPYEAGKAATTGYTYMKLSGEVSETGSGTFDLPDAYKEKESGKDYHVYILAEDVNGAKETDYASEPVEITIPVYSSYLVADTDTTETLSDKVVKFNGIDWYIIRDNSTAVNAGTVTLFAKDPISAAVFDSDNTNIYYDSDVRSFLDSLTKTGKAFADVADTIVAVYLKDVVTDAKLWLLSDSEAKVLPEAVRKCSQASGAAANIWWLRSRGPNNGSNCVKIVDGPSGIVDDIGVMPANGSTFDSNGKLGVRPALKLDLSSVIFNPDTRAFAIPHSVTVTPGSHMTKTTDSGATEQNVAFAMTDVVYTADDGYYFPENYSVDTVNGISVTRDSFSKITVSGTPTDDAEITLTPPTAKTKPDAPIVATAVNCASTANNDGKLTGVTTAMEYKKSDADTWSDGMGSDIEGLVPGTYYVRIKATDTTLASDNQVLTITAYIKHEVKFKVVNGSWDDGSSDDKIVTLTGHEGDTLKLTSNEIPSVGNKPANGYKTGSWDTEPKADTVITKDVTYTYSYVKKSEDSPEPDNPDNPVKASRPELLKATSNSISVKTVEGVEYSIDEGKTWQTSGVFTELEKNTEYSIIARYAAKDGKPAGEPSEALTVKTLDVKEDVIPENTIPVENGKIETKVVTDETGENDYSVSDVVIPKEVAQALYDSLSPEDQQKVKDGATFTVSLEIKEISHVSETDKKKAEDKVKEEAGVEAGEGVFLDISIYTQLGDGKKEEVHKTDKKISFKVKVPASMISADKEVKRTYFLVHILDDGRIEIAVKSSETEFTVDTDSLSSWYLTYADEKKDNGGNEDPGENNDSGNTGSPAEKVITISDNQPMEYSEETKGDFRIGYFHKIPFYGKAKPEPKFFGEIKVTYNGSTYTASKIKVNMKKHLIQITGLTGADKDTEKAVKKATKGANGLSFEMNPYYVRDTDAVTPKIKKESLKSVKVKINGKDYKAKKGEFSYDPTTKVITFSGNLAGSYTVK